MAAPRDHVGLLRGRLQVRGGHRHGHTFDVAQVVRRVQAGPLLWRLLLRWWWLVVVLRHRVWRCLVLGDRVLRELVLWTLVLLLVLQQLLVARWSVKLRM